MNLLVGNIRIQFTERNIQPMFVVEKRINITSLKQSVLRSLITEGQYDLPVMLELKKSDLCDKINDFRNNSAELDYRK